MQKWETWILFLTWEQAHSHVPPPEWKSYCYVSLNLITMCKMYTYEEVKARAQTSSFPGSYCAGGCVTDRKVVLWPLAK